MQRLAKQLPLQALLYKTTTCLTQPATTFLVSQMKEKPVENNYYKTLPSVGDKHKATYGGIRGIFGTQSNIYGGAFVAKKKSAAKSH